MFQKKRLGIAVAACSLMAGTTAAQSQEERQVEALRGDNFAMEEVLVSARKKTENLQSVPIAIDAIGSERLEEMAIESLADVAKYTPGLTFQVGVLPNDTRPVIRGVNISRGRPNVGILVDGIDISSETMTVAGGGAFANLSLMDLERIEVIKGPQSATYGRSAFSGAVNYVTRRPVATDGVYGNVEVEANEYEYGKLMANVAVPVIEDKLAIGFGLLTSDTPGIWENPNTGGELGAAEQKGGSFSLNYEGDGNFAAYFRAEYADEKYTPRPVVAGMSASNISAEGDLFQLGGVNPNSQVVPVPGGISGFPEVDQATCDERGPWLYLVGQPFPCATMLMGNVGKFSESDIDQSANPVTGRDFEGTSIKNTRLSLELDWQVGEVAILSLTGYTNNETRVQEDFDLTDFDLESNGPGSAMFDPQYRFADPFGNPPDFTPLDNNPNAAQTQFGVNTNSDTSFEYQQFSQEFRFSGDIGNLEWMADVLYWAEDMDTVMNQMWWARESMDTDYWNSQLSRFADPTCRTPGQVDTCLLFTGVQTEMVPNPIPMSRDTEHMSIAGSFIYNFSDTFRGTFEGRYLQETIDYESVPISTFINGFLNMPYFDPATGSFEPPVQKEQIKETEFVPRISVDWQATDNVFTYASAGMGFKPGGIATTDGNGDIQTGHYKPETLWSYEIGMKSDLAGNRLRLNASLFYNDYTDQQVPFFVNNGGVTNVSITNAGESQIVGGEIEAIYRPSANWTFMASWTHSKTEFKEFNISDVGTPGLYDKIQSGNAEGDFAGKSFTNTPENIAVMSIRYDGQFSNGLDYFTELFGNYQDKRYLDQGNLSYLPEVFLADFTAGLVHDNWQVIAYVNNLADEDKIQSGLGNVSYGFMPVGRVPPFSANLTLPQPRTFGARVRYRF